MFIHRQKIRLRKDRRMKHQKDMPSGAEPKTFGEMQFSENIPLPGPGTGLLNIETTGLSWRSGFICMAALGIVRGTCMDSKNIGTEQTPSAAAPTIPREMTLDCIFLIAYGRREERALLERLRSEIQGASKIVTYGGKLFTIPFLNERGKMYFDDAPLTDQTDFDFFRGIKVRDVLEQVRPCRKFLPLDSLKKYEVEKFAGFSRHDAVSGRELAKIYQNWENLANAGQIPSDLDKIHKAEAGAQETSPLAAAAHSSGLPAEHTAEGFRDFLVDHLRQDLISLCYLNAMGAYKDFLEGRSFKDISAVLCTTSSSQEKETEILAEIVVKLSRPVPRAVRWKNSYAEISVSRSKAVFHIPAVRARMKYFLPGPVSDYYYLPEEDMAIHKSVAQFVDKKHRQRATAATCYSVREGFYLRSPRCGSLRLFRPAYDSREYYFLFDQEDTASLSRYLAAVLGS